LVMSETREKAYKAKKDFVEGWIAALQNEKLAINETGVAVSNEWATMDYCQNILHEYLEMLEKWKDER